MAFMFALSNAVRKETSAVLTQTPQSTEKYHEVLQAAESRYRQSPDWVSFFREVLGVEGLVRKAFPTFDELSAFEQSEQYDKIQKLLVKLREKRPSADTESEPTRVITVRLPKSMHEALRTEAHDLRTSMNKLCISKLLQVIDEEMIPNERGGTASTSASTGSSASSGAAQPASLASRPQFQPTASVAGTTYGQNHQAHGLHQPHSVTPPYKPAQPRF
jgi:predicted HicB family RNase H-like nuclease